MKINMGCGFNKIDGHLNIDKFASCQPDLVMDLERTPWDLSDNCADEIIFNHSLEHLGQTTKIFFNVIQEIYRIGKNNSLLRVSVPHPRHESYLNDPTHVRPITPNLLKLFSKKHNLIIKEAGASDTQLAFYLGVDLEIQNYTVIPDKRFILPNGQCTLTFSEIEERAFIENNVISEYSINLIIKK